jgi:hypothetical protein
MRAIYVLEGEDRVGPFTSEEIRSALADGSIVLSQMGWLEGAEDWQPLSEILASGEAEADEILVIAEGPGYVLTDQALRVCDEVFELSEVMKATVEVEHTRRGPAMAATALFGFLVIVVLALPFRPQSAGQWWLWGVSLLLFTLLCARFALAAFKPSATFLAVHLCNGDDRVLPMTGREAREAQRAIEGALAREPASAEGAS